MASLACGALCLFIALFCSLLVTVGFDALVGLAYVTIGHAILYTTHHSGFKDVPISSSLKVGAVGGAAFASILLAAGLLLILLSMIIMISSQNSDSYDLNLGLLLLKFQVLSFVLGLAVGAANGALGAVILTRTGEGNILSVSQAALAGCIGWAVIAAGITVPVIFIISCTGCGIMAWAWGCSSCNDTIEMD